MKRFSWGKDIDNMIKDNIQLYGFNPGIRKSVLSLNKLGHNNYRRRKRGKNQLTTTSPGEINDVTINA